jgi:hypothetical protein
MAPIHCHEVKSACRRIGDGVAERGFESPFEFLGGHFSAAHGEVLVSGFAQARDVVFDGDVVRRIGKNRFRAFVAH